MDPDSSDPPQASGVAADSSQVSVTLSREDDGPTTEQNEGGRDSGEEARAPVPFPAPTANGTAANNEEETIVSASLAANNAPDVDNVPDGTATSTQPSSPPTAGLQSINVTTAAWKSWKIRPPWLTLLFTLNIAFVTTILTLDSFSKRNHGFVGLGDAPGFLARDPSLEQAIWTQGIFYTALPAFIMTLFQTAWHAAVAAFAERQPYVELKTGGPARTTILLEYTEPFALSWYTAFKNEHYLLAACMFSSATLVFLVVPLTSFLFTTAQPKSSHPLRLSAETAFNTSILGQYPSYPNLRFMDTAAAIHIQGASPPPWTDGLHAFPSMAPLNPFGGGNVTFDSVAYSAHADCVHLEEKSYRRLIQRPEDTGLPAITITVFANDRGCQISTSSNFRLSPEAPKISINSWTTTTCPPHAGWSRFSFLVARITESHEIVNLSFVSCAPSYRTSKGNVTATWAVGSTSPAIASFQVTNVSESRSAAVWRFFEMGFQAVGCYDPSADIDTNEFGRQVYRLASHKSSASALLPQTIIESAQTMFTTMYAIFANLYLLQKTDAPTITVGTTFVQSTRLTVVSPIAYIIVGILLFIEGFNVALFRLGTQESILDEEPIGILGAASILHGSEDIEVAIREAKLASKYKNRVVLTPSDDSSKLFEGYIWRYKQGKLGRDLVPGSRNQNPSSTYMLENLSQGETQDNAHRTPDGSRQPCAGVVAQNGPGRS
ncbi:hypothetical protein AYL99_09265 [Fonsecaea erecta]|uniref:Uncharacterized protein n=1 Tax=Fonsecaea erecta TaxID=1367422 RepID=A0A178Z9F8_9EURO|nr:hypothetical protein AYL99_09265 [Fonsecaea erecta]OAP56086.1 hypothetical protein AYL99_09265 [Fonsecaea erecta]